MDLAYAIKIIEKSLEDWRVHRKCIRQAQFKVEDSEDGPAVAEVMAELTVDHERTVGRILGLQYALDALMQVDLDEVE